MQHEVQRNQYGKYSDRQYRETLYHRHGGRANTTIQQTPVMYVV